MVMPLIIDDIIRFFKDLYQTIFVKSISLAGQPITRLDF